MVLFLLWLCPFILSGVIFPLIFSSILGTYPPGEFIFQCPIFLPFHTLHGVIKARILKWFAIPFSSGPHFVRTLHHDVTVLSGPILMAYFHWVRQGCGPCVDWLVFCDCGFSPSTLWCPLSVPTVLVGFLLSWMWCISSPPPFLTLDVVYLLTTTVPDLGRGVSPHHHHSWPWTWGISSRPLAAPALHWQDFIKHNSPVVFLIAFLSSPSLWEFSVMQEGSQAPKPWNLFSCSLSLSLCQALARPAALDPTTEGTGWIRIMATPTVT